MGWLKPQEHHKVISVNAAQHDWVLFNKQQTGYYRVLYDEHNYKLLTKQLNDANFTVIHRLNRAQLLDDTFDLAGQGFLPFSTFFQLFGYMKRESDYAPWGVAQRVASELTQLLSHTKHYSRLQTFMAGIMADPYAAVGIENQKNEHILRKSTRRIIVNLACEFGVTACQRAMYAKVQQVINQNVTLHPNTYDFVYGNGIRNASDGEVNRLWQYFIGRSRQYDDERLALASSFGRIINRNLLPDFIKTTVQSNEMSAMSKAERLALFKSIIERDEFGLLLGIDLIQRRAADAKANLEELNKILPVLAARTVTANARTKVRLVIRRKFLNTNHIYFSNHR